MKKSFLSWIVFLSISMLVLLTSCGELSWQQFNKDSLIARVDSVKAPNIHRNPRVFHIQVHGTWYTLPTDMYRDLSNYIAKGDSVFKEAGRWDITVKRYEGNRVVEKYFQGAQGYWE